jgi:hypothetical protein
MIASADISKILHMISGDQLQLRFLIDRLERKEILQGVLGANLIGFQVLLSFVFIM